MSVASARAMIKCLFEELKDVSYSLKSAVVCQHVRNIFRKGIMKFQEYS